MPTQLKLYDSEWEKKHFSTRLDRLSESLECHRGFHVSTVERSSFSPLKNSSYET